MRALLEYPLLIYLDSLPKFLETYLPDARAPSMLLTRTLVPLITGFP